jgi:putative phosphotransacetylase
MELKIETSARHIHLTEEDFKTLFGDIDPTPIKDLSQQDKACKELVEAIGPKSSLKNIRVIIPFREGSQLEISKTDSIALGVEAPLKLSGDLPGAKIKIIGPFGTIDKEIAIVAKRHLHLSPEEAEKLKLKDNDYVEVKVSGDRQITFDNIVVRTADNFFTTVHLDTDEANAAGLSSGASGELII